VESGVQCVAGGQVDQANVRSSRPVALSEHDAAEVVLADQGQAAAEPLPVPAATDDLPEALLPRSTISRVSSVPTLTAAHAIGSAVRTA
jgi:hypothetical protein